jgi:hypothetical protein
MPIHYVRDDTHKRILVTTMGEIGLDDIVGIVDRQAKDRTTLVEAERWLQTL